MTARENGSASTLCRAGSWKWNFGLRAAGALWGLCLGNPGETLDRRWFDQTLRWQAALNEKFPKSLGWTPPEKLPIVIVGIDDTDFEELTSPEEGHRAAARSIREASLESGG